jgi:hypothetical protein
VLARRRRDALDAGDDGGEYRRRQRELMAALGAPGAPFVRFAARIPAMPAELLPDLLHVAAVRLGGADEALAYVLWERTLESLSRVKAR